MFIPKISFSASSTIKNPYFEMYPKIVEPCKLSLPTYGILLVFKDKSVTFCINPGTEKKDVGNLLVEPLIEYLTFGTYVNYYHIVGAPEVSSSELHTIPCVDTIIFKLNRFSKQTNDKGSATKILPTELYKTKYSKTKVLPVALSFKKESAENYLSVLNYELYLAIKYYLIGCQNIQYFLIEFYKSVEIVKNFFGNVKTFKKCLEPFGLNFSEYKKFKQLANDQRNPLNIGRHAPQKGTMFSFVDIKNLLSEPKSIQVFEESTHFCRALIDIFIHYLKGGTVRKEINPNKVN